MVRLSSLEQIERLYAKRGGLTYGENVTQTEHALQCAALAQADGATPSLVVAALLHDVGHLLEQDEAAAEHGLDHDDFGLVQSKIINVIDSKKLERVAGGKPLRTFRQPALDDHHETFGAQALRGLFDEAVRGPIALHVRAKRYLCLRQAAYFQSLSPASRRSLELQGGPFDTTQADDFERLPFWKDALALRRFDDLGKRAEPSGCCFTDFAPLMHGLLIASARS
jgi:predicted HD phosphohydrolase